MNLQLNQALFGYDRGHQLLAASAPLPTDARHFLAVATDLSGSSPARGFDCTYTGLPLPGTNFYALFCTWLAPEMSRPGCVWSHVLLIDLADMAEISDFGGLRSIFRRPVLRPVLEYFSHPVKAADGTETPSELSVSPTAAEHLLEALYGQPDKPVVVSATEATEHEQLIFALWSQQWPRLRRHFRFSTGSFSDRGREGRPFDIQVVPEVNLSYWNPSSALMTLANQVNRKAAGFTRDTLVNHFCEPH